MCARNMQYFTLCTLSFDKIHFLSAIATVTLLTNKEVTMYSLFNSCAKVYYTYMTHSESSGY